MFGIEAAQRLSELLPKGSSILDIGSGKQAQAEFFRQCGHNVHTLDIAGDSVTYLGDFMEIEIPEQYDAVWCSHCLEHQLNPHDFLKKLKTCLNPTGLAAITVPPLKHQIVGGHVSLWNAGLLLYNLVLAGFDCSKAQAKQYGYNISVIVRNSEIKLPKLKRDHGDIEALKHYFPEGLQITNDNFNGNIEKLNW